MKKTSALVFVLILAIILCFAGCRETGGTDSDVSSAPQASNSSSNEFEVIEGGTGGVYDDTKDGGEDSISSAASSGEESSSSSDPVDITTPDSEPDV